MQIIGELDESDPSMIIANENGGLEGVEGEVGEFGLTDRLALRPFAVFVDEQIVDHALLQNGAGQDRAAVRREHHVHHRHPQIQRQNRSVYLAVPNLHGPVRRRRDECSFVEFVPSHFVHRQIVSRVSLLVLSTVRSAAFVDLPLLSTHLLTYSYINIHSSIYS